MVSLRPSLIAAGIATLAPFATASAMFGGSPFELGNRTSNHSSVESSIGTFTYCGVDLIGGDQFVARYPNPDLCVANCLPQTGCNAATWTNFEGGTCYFKRLVQYPMTPAFPAVYAVPKVGAVSFLRTGDDTPFPNPGVLWSYDMPGNDISNYQTRDHVDCFRTCEGWERCFAFTWSSNGIDGSGTCWLKSRASPYVYASNAASIFVGQRVNPSTCLANR